MTNPVAAATPAPATVPADAPDLPQSWRNALAAIPPRFRPYYESIARAAQTRVLAAKAGTDAGELECQSAGNATGLALIQYGAFLPYHLIAEPDIDAALRYLQAKGPAALLTRLNERYPQADTVLVLGDNPDGAEVMTAVEQMLAAKPACAVVCGPGPTLEPLLRSPLAALGFPTFFVRGTDDGGARWSMPPGDTLEKTVQRFFVQHRPDRVLVVEPVRTPAARIALDIACSRNLPCTYVAPAARRDRA